jgi:phosphomevalonate kinase
VRAAARAPGKLILLGEYAVLEGGPALVLAVDRHCRAAIEPSETSLCRLVTTSDARRERAFSPGTPSGVPLVDIVLAAGGPLPAWQATLDSSALHAGGLKLGLGSSAAMLCAFAAAVARFARAAGSSAPAIDLASLVALHRALQRGRGSGIDVAASLIGGVLSYRLDGLRPAAVSSVRMPEGVGFAGIFAGSSASTVDLVARFEAWKLERPVEAAAVLEALVRTANMGCTAVETGDALGLLAAVREYGDRLETLGAAMGADIVTARHLEIRREADRCGVAYKVSGAGGGDMGIALSTDAQALRAFKRAVERQRCEVLDLGVDALGLSIEELE